LWSRFINIPALYQRFFVDKKDERRNLFRTITELYNPQKGIYPGSFVHITPSFYLKEMTYIDSDRRMAKFFQDENVHSYIRHNKVYSENPIVRAFQSDFSSDLDIEKDFFDIMFSFYAGFISQTCKKYLKNKGLLLCNNSHGDGSIAYTDDEYELAAVILRDGENFSITTENLEEYFIKKDGSSIDKWSVLNRMKGEKYIREGYAYLFRFKRNLNND